MTTPPRRFFSTSSWLIVLYSLVMILYLAWSTIPLRARPLLAGTIPTDPTTSRPPTRTATPTKTPKATKTPTSAPGATSTATYTATPTNTPKPLPGLTATSTEIATPTPTPTAENVQVVVTKTDFLFNDADGNSIVSPGDKLLYAITIINSGKVSVQQLRLEDTLDPNATLVEGMVKTDKGIVSKGNSPGDAQVMIEINTLAPGERAIVSLQVSIKLQVTDTQVQNQAVATFVNEVDGLSEQIVVLSDDPDTNEALDATITPLNGNQPRPSNKLFLPFISYKTLSLIKIARSN
jgi:uncharacterized repeat protein (TIGR01451 family)